MKRKVSIIVLSIIIAAQILITSTLAVYGYNADKIIEKYGKDYKFKVKVYSVYDMSIGYYLENNRSYFGLYGDDNESYAEIVTDENGFSKIKELGEDEKRPEEYISLTNENAFPRRNYYDISETVDGYLSIDYETEKEISELDAYITVKIWRGQPLVTGFYIDGTEYDDFFASLEKEKEENGEDINIFEDEDGDGLVDFDEYF